MSIVVSKVTKLYGTQRALDDVSFEIPSGKIVGFLGPNGAGKSTLMKIITGFIPPSSGEILVNDLDVVTQSMEIKRMLGYLPENNPLYTDMYVREYLEFVAHIYKLGKKSRQRVDEMIERTGLTIEQKKKIGALSKGYRQRVGLAQALIHDPRVLILDEPTSGLDPNQIIEIRGLISEVSREKTVLLSTHIMQEVEAICNQIIVINQGKIVAHDSTSNIQHNYSQDLNTIEVEFDQKIKLEELEKIKGVQKVLHPKGFVYLVQHSPETDVRTDIFNFAVKNKITVLQMQKKEKSLEAVFQELTREK